MSKLFIGSVFYVLAQVTLVDLRQGFLLVKGRGVVKNVIGDGEGFKGESKTVRRSLHNFYSVIWNQSLIVFYFTRLDCFGLNIGKLQAEETKI